MKFGWLWASVLQKNKIKSGRKTANINTKNISKTSVIVHFNTATPNSTNFASKLFYYVFFNL